MCILNRVATFVETNFVNRIEWRGLNGKVLRPRAPLNISLSGRNLAVGGAKYFIAILPLPGTTATRN